ANAATGPGDTDMGGPAPGRTTPSPRGTGNHGGTSDGRPSGNSRPHGGTADPGNTSPPDRSPADARPADTSTGPELRAKVNLTIPMGTATGQGNRPGEAWELGALDPALARQLLAAAARSPGSEF